MTKVLTDRHVANPLDNLRPWPKGVSGNPKGYSRGRRLIDELEEFIAEKGDKPAILARWLKGILGPDFRYFKEYIERRDGKAPELNLDGGDEEKPKPRIEIGRRKKRAGSRKARGGDRNGHAAQ